MFFFNTEKKLSKIQNRQNSDINKTFNQKKIAKEILKFLSEKRDAIFQQGIDTSSCDNELEETDLNKVYSISTMFANTTLYSSLEKKICPQSHSINPEEVKKLVEGDFLDILHNNNLNHDESTKEN